MRLLLRNALLCLVIFSFCLFNNCSPMMNKRVVKVSLERPVTLYENHDIARVLNVTSRRTGRSDPTHYIQIWVEFFIPLDHTSTMTVKIYEFLSNEYRPTFVEATFKACSFFLNFMSVKLYYTSDLAVPLKPYDVSENCYFKTGFYHYANMSLPLASIPEHFPFEKGRVFINHTYKDKIIMSGRVDIELKMMPLQRHNGHP